MYEDFGWFGDESFLERDEFIREVDEAMNVPLDPEYSHMDDLDFQADRWEEENDMLAQEQETEDERDGDAESALSSCGWGMDEDYSCGEYL
jgi:hypothetical protein